MSSNVTLGHHVVSSYHNCFRRQKEEIQKYNNCLIADKSSPKFAECQQRNRCSSTLIFVIVICTGVIVIYTVVMVIYTVFMVIYTVVMVI